MFFRFSALLCVLLLVLASLGFAILQISSDEEWITIVIQASTIGNAVVSFWRNYDDAIELLEFAKAICC